MAFTYPAMVAWDPNGKQTVKNVSFQVYATSDTAFTTPLAITDPFGNALPGNILNSGSQGVFPQFQQASNATVVIADASHLYAWTVIAIQPPTQDSTVAGFVNTAGTQTRNAIDALPVPDGALASRINDPGSQATAALKSTNATSQMPAARASLSLSRRYDAATMSYGADANSLRNWRVALAKAAAGNRAARITWVGDSISFGQYAKPTAQGSSSSDVLRNALDAKYGRAGSGIAYLTNGQTAQDPRYVITGAVDASGYGPFNGMAQKLAPGNTITFTETCDTFTIYYVDQWAANNGSFTYSIDGGATVTVPTQGQSLNVTAAAKTTVAAGGYGKHTITLGTAATNGAMVVGVEASIGTAGVRVTRMAVPGSEVQWARGNDTNGGTAGADGFGFNLAPADLTIIAFGHNEYLNSRTTASFSTNLSNMIDTARAGGGDVLLLTTVPNQNQGLTPAQSAFDNTVYTVAESKGAAVLDVSALFGTYAASSSLYVDATHPANDGYPLIGQAVANFIAPTPALIPAAPTVYAADQFNRADNASPGNTSVGNFAWNPRTASWTIAGKLLHVNTTFETDCVADDGQANGSIAGTLLTDPATYDGGMVFRYQDSNNFWLVWIQGGSGGALKYSLMKKSGGAFTTVATSTVAPKPRDTIKVKLNGWGIRVHINGAEVFNVVDSYFNGATKHGFWASGTAVADFAGYAHASA